MRRGPWFGVAAIALAGGVVALLLADSRGGAEDAGSRHASQAEAPPLSSPSAVLSGTGEADPRREASATDGGSSNRVVPIAEAPPIRGIVVDESERPVAGAVIERVFHVSDDPPSATVEPTGVTSGPDGTFRLDDDHDNLHLRARAPGLATRGGDVSVDRTVETRIVLAEEGSLSVRVVDRRSRAGIASAHVEVLSGEGTLPDWAFPFARGTTGDDGHVALSLARPAPETLLVVVARAPDHAQGMALLRHARPPLSTVVELPEGGTVEGEVVDADGRPVPGAIVSMRAEGRYRKSTETGKAGDFVFLHVPSPVDRGLLWVDEELHLLVESEGSPSLRQTVRLPEEEQTVHHTLRLARWRDVAGRVVRADGNPAAGLVVTVSRPATSFGTWEGGASAETGSDGRFLARHVASGAAEIDVKTPHGYPLTSMTVSIPPDGDVPEVLVTLEGGAGEIAEPFRLRVIDAAGAPVHGARVTVIVGSGRNATHLGDEGESGIVTLTGVPKGRLLVSARGEAGPAVAYWIDVPPPRDPTDLRLGSAVITGRLVRSDGTPVAGRVRLTPLAPDAKGSEWSPLGFSDDEADALPTASDGRFRFVEVGEGLYRIAYRLPGESVWYWDRAVRASDGDVALVVSDVSDPGILAVELREEDGRPADALTITVTLSTEDAAHYLYLRAVPDEPALFRSSAPPSDVEPGIYDVAVYPGRGYQTVRLGRQRIGKEELRLAVTRSRGPTLVGRVRDAVGAPVAGAKVMAWTDEEMGLPSDLPSVLTRSDGSFRLEGLPGVRVRVAVSGDFVVGRGVDVDTATSGTVEVEVERAGVIEARVRDGVASKAKWGLFVDPPVGSVDSKASLKRASGEGLHTARVGGLRPGRYPVRVVWDGKESSLGEIEVVARKTTEVLVPPK